MKQLTPMYPTKDLLGRYAKYINDTAKGKAAPNPLKNVGVYKTIGNIVFDDSWQPLGIVKE